MSGIADHVWGVSETVDRVWAQVSGLRPRMADDRIIEVLQIYADESEAEDGTFVLAGYLSTAEKWAAFSAEWEIALPKGTLNQAGKYHFKMSEMCATAERRDRIPYFLRIIEDYVMCAISVTVRKSDMQLALDKTLVIGHSGEVMEVEGPRAVNPYALAFSVFLQCVAENRNGWLSDSSSDTAGKFDLMFDYRLEKRKIISSWDSFLENNPQLEGVFNSHPRFEDDTEFLPIQAADLLAWCVRRAKLDSAYIGNFVAPKHNFLFHIDVDVNVDYIQNQIMMTAANNPLVSQVIDLRKSE